MGIASKLFLIGFAGALGTLARYGLSLGVQRWTGNGYPWPTAGVNVLGCFLFGVVWALADVRGIIGPEWRVILLAGFMGGFTTFSSLVFETSQLLTHAQVLLAIGNIVVQLVAGLCVFYLGGILVRAV